MNAPNDGGPAFPTTWEIYSGTGMAGMSLRDWLAGQALAGMVAGARGLEITASQFGAQSYVIADAMLVARGGAK